MDDLLTALVQQEFFISAVLTVMLAMLITGKGLTTSNRYHEQRERLDRSEQRAELAEKSLRENTARLEHLSNVLADTNETLKLLIRERKP